MFNNKIFRKIEVLKKGQEETNLQFDSLSNDEVKEKVIAFALEYAETPPSELVEILYTEICENPQYPIIPNNSILRQSGNYIRENYIHIYPDGDIDGDGLVFKLFSNAYNAYKERDVKKIAYYRIIKGMTQNILAGEMGVKPEHVQAWEYGTRRPNGKNLIKLAEVLGVEPKELL